MKNCLFGATNIDGKCDWSFGNNLANSSSFHNDNLKNGFLNLGEGDTFGINESFGAPE